MTSSTDFQESWFLYKTEGASCIIQGRRDYENLMPATIGISKMIKNK
jgi:hypothetical protein